MREMSNFNVTVQKTTIFSIFFLNRSTEDLGLRFAVFAKGGFTCFFLGMAHKVYSPTIRTFSEMAKHRSQLEPFRSHTKQKIGRGRGSLIWQHSPLEVEHVWECFQTAVKEVWEDTGRSEAQLQRIRRLYKSNAAVREKHLQYWEAQHMAMHDKPKQRSTLPSPKQLLRRLTMLRRLLGRWANVLKKDEKRRQLAERRRLLKKRQAERVEGRRLEHLKRKRAKEEQKTERLRREALRRRMKNPDLTMDDLLGGLGEESQLCFC